MKWSGDSSTANRVSPHLTHIFFFNLSAAFFRALVTGLLPIEDAGAVKSLCMVFCDCARLEGKRKWGRRLVRERSARRIGTKRSGVRICSKRSGIKKCIASLRMLASDAPLLVKGFTEVRNPSFLLYVPKFRRYLDLRA